MRSFALWYKGEDDKKVDIHINLWNKKGKSRKWLTYTLKEILDKITLKRLIKNVGNKKRTNYCFDIGLLVEDIRDIETISLYAPFEISKENIRDLGSIISTNELASAIFNEDVTVHEVGAKKYKVNDADNKIKNSFIIYHISVKDEIVLNSCQVSEDHQGTIIELNTKDIMEHVDEENDETAATVKAAPICKYYFRIRIEVPEKHIKLINTDIKGVSVLSDSFTTTEIIDFRINDIRSCSSDIRDKYSRYQRFKIDKIHYLILRNVSDIILQYGNAVSCRMLEKNIWENYIEGSHDNLIAYHIKRKSEEKNGEIEYITSFNVLTRFQYKKNTILVIIIYIIGIIVLGAVGSWISPSINNIIECIEKIIVNIYTSIQYFINQF